MKNQNTKDILEEILLRMKYDSSKTLTENKKLIFEQPVDYENLPAPVMPGFVQLTPEQEIEGWEAIRTPDNKILYVPEGTVVTGLWSSEDWDLSTWMADRKGAIYVYASVERGGKGNDRTDPWIPVDMRGVFKIGSVKTFKTPDGQEYGCRFNNPKIPKTWDAFYRMDPQPYSWQFSNYYNTSTNKSYNLSPDKSKIVSGESEVVQEIMDDLYPRNKEQVELFQKFLNFYYPTWYNGSTLSQSDKFFGTMGQKTKGMFDKKEVQESWNLFLNGYGTALSNSGFPKMAEPPKNDRSYYYAGNTRHEIDILQYEKQKNEWFGKFINNFGEEFFRYYFPDEARKMDIGRGAKQNAEYEKELEALKKQYPILFDNKSESATLNPNYDNIAKEFNEKVKKLQEKYKLTKFNPDNYQTITTGRGNPNNSYFTYVTDIEIPKGSKITNFDGDSTTTNFETFKNSFVIDPLIGELQLQDFWSTTYKSIFNKHLENTVMSFTLPPPHNDLTYKRKIYRTGGKLYITIDKFYTNIGGKITEYVARDFREPTWWDKYGDKILLVGSLVVSILGPQTWPFIIGAVAIDAVAAADAYRQGNIEGAKLAALLALVPILGKLAIRTTKAEYDLLSKKFIDATTKDDVARIMSELSEDELKLVKSAQELGDIQGILNNAEVKSAIKKGSDQIKGMPTKLKQRIGVELVTAGSILLTSLPDIRAEALEGKTRVSAYNYLLKQILNSVDLSKTKLTPQEIEKVKSQVRVNIPIDQILNEMKEKTALLKKAADLENKKELDKSEKNLQYHLEILRKMTEQGDPNVVITKQEAKVLVGESDVTTQKQTTDGLPPIDDDGLPPIE